MTQDIAALAARLETRSTQFGSIPYGGSERVVDKQSAAALRSQAADIERLAEQRLAFEKEVFDLRNEVERLERERDEARILLANEMRRAEDALEGEHYAKGVADLAMKHRDAAEKDAAELREALKPFGKYVERLSDKCPDNTVMASHEKMALLAQDFRRARAAYSKES